MLRTAALLLWSCLLTEARPARAQAPAAGLVPGSPPAAPSAAFARLRAGQPFPFAHGVGIELRTYRAVRHRTLLAERVIASKRRLTDSLAALLRAEQHLRVLADERADLALAEAARQARAADALTRVCDEALAAARRPPPLLARRGFWWGVAGAAAGGLVGGIVLSR